MLKHPKINISAVVRLKLVRILAQCDTRKRFSDFSQIPLATLEAWERGANELTPKGARRVCRALEKAGIICHEKWLLCGEGVSPFSAEANYRREDIPIKNLPLECQLPSGVLHEARTFLTYQPLGILCYITDDSMAPLYSPGDLVGGIKQPLNQVKNFLYKNCIIEKKSGDCYVRRLLPGIREGLFSTTCLNPDTQKIQITEYNINMASCSYVIWHRHIV